MIDITVPEAIRFRSSEFSVTKELRCPVCGGRVHYRSWDAEHEAFAYHCTYCGHDTKITWPAAAVLRAKGEVKFDDAGDPIVPEDFEVPPIPEDPDNAAYEVWEVMQEIDEGPSGGGQGAGEDDEGTHTITINASGCSVNNENSISVKVNDGANYVFTVIPLNSDISIVTNDDINFESLGIEVDKARVTSEEKRGLTWTTSENSVTFTLANVVADHSLTVSCIDDNI
jgi:predicted RNA-binding Zn-ribbon protein involved in translation (DUF1610 family)